MTKQTEWRQNFVALSRDELLVKVASQMSNKRFQHVLRVEEKALEIAGKFPMDLEKVSIAALTHDYAKERPDEEMIARIKKSQVDQTILSFGNAIWHGVMGAEIVQEELGITDAEILQAIRVHTTGDVVMTLLDKIIFVADYVEEGRDFPGVEDARQLALTNLDEAVRYEIKQTLLFLASKNQKIYPKTIDVYNTWVANYKEDLC
ncbi:bis(5'-nucleosyl)-tetraphosphatase (symmetrical) YqeK [Vagococcus sp.]|uniref:bis(5'-nucleosyl)-tetraphosphatase (symmetrical) YqeK n=1 Tax=Vagococcus sp. TaxID=1933889 RepID=UPI003F95775E